jgi:Zn-dependent metalloprotease
MTSNLPGQPPRCSIAPPDVLAAVAERGSPPDRQAALRALSASAALRAQRTLMTEVVRQLGVDLAELPLAPARPQAHLSVYDAGHGSDLDLPGRLLRGDGDQQADDQAADQAYDGAGDTHRFYRVVLGRDSVDGKGLELVSSVHFGDGFDNAFWNGSQMVYGDGSGRIFAVGSLTSDVAVIAHELSHGVTQFTCGLRYHNQSGALNESFSDVIGSLVKQFLLGQTADQADWLIGAGILGSALHGQALRSLKAPGTAFDLDRQPADMDGYLDLPDDGDPHHDHGGVHVNSGIPNRAFQLAATAIGGNAWERTGRIWYTAFTERLGAEGDFPAAARATVEVAGELYGADGAEQQAVRAAWDAVKVRLS